MSINKQFRTEKSRETEGVVIEYTDMNGNVLAWFKCRRPGGRNIDFHKVLNRKLREHRQEMEGLEEAEAEVRFRKIWAEAYAEAVIVDWGGQIDGPDGKPAGCTHENIVWLFSEDCPDLFDDLRNQLSLRSRWRQEDKEAARKNSKAASNTK